MSSRRRPASYTPGWMMMTRPRGSMCHGSSQGAKPTLHKQSAAVWPTACVSSWCSSSRSQRWMAKTRTTGEASRGLLKARKTAQSPGRSWSRSMGWWPPICRNTLTTNRRSSRWPRSMFARTASRARTTTP